ncbi:hypothetical protein [Rubrivivax sp. JA1026]|uniref:hypothetical protein n=1 Tax=Rubrivivax sp. JA1026 TaxID=2710888 RepID=UPI0013E93299|nr:hypothetical protein [Rubrivivax sp. JA1026]
MKLSATLCMLLLPVTVLAASDLPLRMARDKGFAGCDAAITKAFEHAGGDVRVSISQFPETKADSIKLTATAGSPGDSIYIEAEFRRVGSKCYWTQTAILSSEKSCMAYKEDLSAFKFVAQNSDFTWTENKGGVNMILKGVGSGCMAIFQLDN